MIHVWSDPVIRAPLFGSIALALAVSLMGGWLFVRRRTLIGEALSHASYPGVALAIFFTPWIPLESTVLLFAAISALIGLWLVHLLKHELRIKEDAALCFVLATFFGMGTLVASIIQVTHPSLFRQIPIYLYGQAATMDDTHLYLYACFALIVIGGVLLCYRPLLVLSFDREFGKASSLPLKWIDGLFVLFVAFAVVLGMRSLGIILLSALMIAPPIAARQFTHHLPTMLLLSACFGMASGCIGTLVSLSGLPTGPCVVLVASGFALFALGFAPRRGVIFRILRAYRFRMRAQQENLLKALWALPAGEHKAPRWLWWWMKQRRWIDAGHRLTPLGVKKGARIVRLHRLWEAYLVHSLGMGVDRVHHNAEEMEHVLTPQLEEELTRLLADPCFDPHAQPIPKLEGA